MYEINVNIFRRKDRDNRYFMQYADPMDGRKVRKDTGTTSERKALKIAAKWEEEVRATHGQPDGRYAWDEFVERYDEECLGGLADNTQRKALGVLSVYQQMMRPKKLADVTTAAMVRYQKRLRDAGRSENTIKGHIAHLQSALGWARRVKLISTVPEIPKTHRVRKAKKMKGRPITVEEYERMLAKVPAVILKSNLGKSHQTPETDWDRVPSWRRFIEGLWHSGLRLSEAMQLHWTDETKLCVDLDWQYPMLRIPRELEKGHRDRLWPMVPEFAEFLLEVPESRRHGYVFEPLPQRYRHKRLMVPQVGRIVARIGQVAGVKVDTTRAGKAVYASAHDLRRSFGERWADKVMPKTLMELMRHESIETTQKFYVGRNAQRTANILWEAHRANLGTPQGTQDLKMSKNL